MAPSSRRRRSGRASSFARATLASARSRSRSASGPNAARDPGGHARPERRSGSAAFVARAGGGVLVLADAAARVLRAARRSDVGPPAVGRRTSILQGRAPLAIRCPGEEVGIDGRDHGGTEPLAGL